MTLKSGNCQAAETLEQPLRSKNKRWLASFVDTIQYLKEIVDSVSEVSESFTYPQSNALHNKWWCFSLCFLCLDVLKLVNSGLTIQWQKNYQKCKSKNTREWWNTKITLTRCFVARLSWLRFDHPVTRVTRQQVSRGDKNTKSFALLKTQTPQFPKISDFLNFSDFFRFFLRY